MSKPIVAVLAHAADMRASVCGGLGDAYVARQHASVHDLRQTLATADVVLVVIEAVDPEGRSMGPTIASIRHDFPTIPVLAYCSLTTAGSPAVLDVARSGATGLVFRGVDDTRHAMRTAIGAAQQGAVNQRVWAAVAPHLPPAALPLLRYAISRSVEEPSVTDAAQSLGVDRKTLFNWLKPCGGIGPREFINWIRVALGVGMLENPRRTAEQIALSLGFSSGTSYRNMLQRYTGARCADCRGPHALTNVLRELVARLTAADRVPVAVGDDAQRAVAAGERPKVSHSA